MRINKWAKRFNIEVRRAEERPDKPEGDVVYRVKDVFTTRDGSWEVSDKEGSVPQWARDAYLRPWGHPEYFDDAGGDHNLFACVLDLEGKPIKTEDLVRFWSEGFETLGDPSFQPGDCRTPKHGSGWANIPVFNHFVPDRDEHGAWCWCPEGAADVIVGGGLPNKWHVSTFAVWQAERRAAEQPSTGTGPTTGTEPEPGGSESSGPALADVLTKLKEIDRKVQKLLDHLGVA